MICTSGRDTSFLREFLGVMGKNLCFYCLGEQEKGATAKTESDFPGMEACGTSRAGHLKIREKREKNIRDYGSFLVCDVN